MNLASFKAFWRTLRQDGPKGDMTIYKCDAFGVRASPAVEHELEAVRGYAPRVDLDALRALPDGTLGREYVRLLDDNGYDAFEITDAVPRDMLARNVFGLRIAVTHDMMHVLTGFDTSWAGELGVLAFSVAQDYARAQRYVALPLALLLYPLRAPWQIPALLRCLRQGWRMGKQARFVLGHRLEDWFARPVGEARQMLDIVVPERSERARWGYLRLPAATAA
jgi:ubiquinone biosynthesis protein COQ4